MPVPDSLPSASASARHYNPYPRQPPGPQPVPHKVWLLDCRSCGMFLTNRGMKAVLLLRPNVSLYSSDALPVNCSVYSPPADTHKPPAPHKPSPSGPPRTCECLTQSLCCHGCGSTIGYMIVVPCARCTSSISATNRATNGHRFVFHSNEVNGTERRYIPHEPAVVPYDPHDYIPTPPLEYATPRFLAHGPAVPQEHKSQPRPQLAQGDIVFWHHLARTGEIAPVAHDPRAREPPAPKRARPILFNR